MKKFGAMAALVALAAWGCSDTSKDEGAKSDVRACGKDLENRAYIISRDSDDLTVLDLNCLEITGNAKIGTQNAHMAEIGRGLEEIVITSSGSNELVFVDTRDLHVEKRIPSPPDPTHMSAVPRRELLAVMTEGESKVAFVDTRTREIMKVLGGFATPHFMRFSKDGKTGYVANLNAHHITRVDMDKLEIEGHVALAGFDGPPNATLAPDEGGFADAQVDENGILFAAHAATGRVLTYDTNKKERLPEINVGDKPWIVFAEHHFEGLVQPHLVPNLGSATLSLIDRATYKVSKTLIGDKEAYGVNYSPLAPKHAYMMNRIREDIAVVDTDTQEVTDRIPVGGNTETASTSADGKYIVATVSSANRVVVIEAATGKKLKVFDKVGRYPWSVVIPRGQNYCH